MCATTPTRITAQDFYDFDKCPHRVYLNRFGDPKEKLPHSDFLDLLFENALRHERDVMAEMICDTPEGSTLEQRALSTLQLIQGVMRKLDAERADVPVTIWKNGKIDHAATQAARARTAKK